MVVATTADPLPAPGEIGRIVLRLVVAISSSCAGAGLAARFRHPVLGLARAARTV